MRMRTPACILFLPLLLACSGSPPDDVSRDVPPRDPPAAGGPSGDNLGGAVEALDVVVNEVVAVGASEWIEIANRGKAAVDLGGYELAGSDKSTNAPKLTDAMRFPTGTRLEPGGRLLVLTSKKDGTVGPHPQADCLPEGPESCYFASFGVSATQGEAIHLLAPDGSVVTSTPVPRSASVDAGGSTAESKCRLPDLTGEFASCALTPGQPNRPL